MRCTAAIIIACYVYFEPSVIAWAATAEATCYSMLAVGLGEDANLAGAQARAIEACVGDGGNTACCKIIGTLNGRLKGCIAAVKCDGGIGTGNGPNIDEATEQAELNASLYADKANRNVGNCRLWSKLCK